MEEKLVFKKPSDIIPYKDNARNHSQEQIDIIIKSINEFGFTNPLLIDEKNNLIAGHGRLTASLQMDLPVIPCRVIKGLSEEQIKALRMVDNKSSELSSWDYTLLDKELEGIFELNMADFGFQDLLRDTKFDDFFTESEQKEKKKKTIICPHCGEEFEI